MDISLNEALENSDKHRDNLDEDAAGELMPEVGESLNSDDQPPMTADGQQSGLQTYQFRSGDNGQVTYRVVQVGGADDNQQATLSIVSTNGIQNILTQGGSGNGTSQVAIVANPFNESSEGAGANSASEGQGAKFAYFPSASGSTGGGQDLSSQADTDSQGVAQGQFYVMMSPQEMLQAGQPASKYQLAPRSQFGLQKLESNRNTAVIVRDSSRRVQHNEVERRRRDKINNWITKLSKLVPDCAGDHSKQGQSKGGILAKACEYILDLQASNQQYAENLKDLEGIQRDYDRLRMQLEEKKQENLILHQTLRNHGLAVDIKSTTNTTQ